MHIPTVSRNYAWCLASLLLGCFGLLLNTEAVSPPPDGGYPGGNTAEGENALLSLTTGVYYNTAVGWFSLQTNLTGNLNTAIGAGTLFANTGENNTAIGAGALFSNTTGSGNAANGVYALFSNTIGFDNTAMGFNALTSNTIGTPNTAVGAFAMFSNTEGFSNTAVGLSALSLNVFGAFNTAIGDGALSNSDSIFNTAVGISALLGTTNGTHNVGVGAAAGSGITTGNENVVIGNAGGDSIRAGSYNIYIGGEVASGLSESNTIRIADNTALFPAAQCFIGGIAGVNEGAPATAVFINTVTGQLGTNPSSERFKKDIVPMGKTSEAIFSLKPVTFHLKNDTTSTPNFGLIAEEVAKVNPDLIIIDKEGKPLTVRYEQINAMLLNEFLKEHKKVEQLEKQVEALTFGLQKVSAQLEATKPTGQLTLKDQ